jgi:hypothetical protein
MSSLIASQSSDMIILVDGTRIEVDTDMHNSPVGFIVTSGPTLAAPDEGDSPAEEEFTNPYLLSAQEIERTLALRR